MERFAIMSVEKLAEFLVDHIDLENVKAKVFPDCDFANIDIDEEAEKRPLEDVRRDASGWYGIKAVDAGFDSEDLIIISDYYGGGCAHMASIYSGEDRADAVRAIKDTILYTLSIQEEVRADTALIVEFMWGWT